MKTKIRNLCYRLRALRNVLTCDCYILVSYKKTSDKIVTNANAGWLFADLAENEINDLKWEGAFD